MAFDPKNLEEILKRASAPLLAFGALFGAVTAGVKWLIPVLASFLDPAIAVPLGIFLPLFACFACLWAAYKALNRKSRLLRPERFDLRVREPNDLLGRQEEVVNLKALIESNRLLLVDGESGSGKSSLISYGLMPDLLSDQSKCPILVSDYSGDWDTGLAIKIFEASWSVLTVEDRTKVGFSERPPIGAVNADTVRLMLSGIGKLLGRTPILILDQFDDYQLAARENFLGSRKDWIKPNDLCRRNHTWKAIRDLMHGTTARLRLLVVTRSDASAGSHSIRLIEQADQIGFFTVGRLKVEWLGQWLERVTRVAPDDQEGDVIANPDAGWTDLKKQLERDLTPSGALLGAVLPQQVRIVFLGLRKLRSLTLPDYRRAASGAGVEALYILDSIATATLESGLSEGDVRAVLFSFVDSAEPSSPKSQVLSFTEMASFVTDAVRLQKALDRLRRDEVIREKPVSGEYGSRWQLDHDYIARAVLAENRAANKLWLALQDGAYAWHTAGSNIRLRYRSLLPLSVQVNLVWARIRSFRGFTYRPFRFYAALSTLRALPIVLLLAAGGWLWHEESLRSSAMQIIDGLNEDRNKGAPAVIALWRASPAVRSYALSRLLDSPARLQAVGTAWTLAFTSIEPSAAEELTGRLLSQLDRDDLDPPTQQSIFIALGTVAGRLDARPAAETAAELISRLDRGSLNWSTQAALINALGRLGERLDGPRAGDMAKNLLSRLDSNKLNLALQESLINALENMAGRLDASGAAATAKELVSRLKSDDSDRPMQEALFNALCGLGGRVDKPEAAEIASELISWVERKNPDLIRIEALSQVTRRLDAASAGRMANELVSQLESKDLNRQKQESVVSALGSLAEPLDPGTAGEIARDLINQLNRKEIDRTAEHSMFDALSTVAGRLDTGGAAETANYLISRLGHDESDEIMQFSEIDVLGVVAGQLEGPTAADIAKFLISRLKQRDLSLSMQESLINALGHVAGRLDARAAAETAAELTSRLDSPAQKSLIDALGRAGGKLDAPGAAKIAGTLVSQLERTEVDSTTRRSLNDALGSVGGRLDPRSAAKIAGRLISQLERTDLDVANRESLTDALGSVGGRLDSVSAADMATYITSELEHTHQDSTTAPSLIDALGHVGENLDPTNAARTIKKLIPWLDRDDLDPSSQQSLIDALASMAVISSALLKNDQIATIRVALGSIAWPLREEQSPAWRRLETISGQKFDFDLQRLFHWLDNCCKLTPDTARPPFGN